MDKPQRYRSMTDDEGDELRALIAKWRARTHVDANMLKVSRSHIYRAAGREQQDSVCAEELEAWLDQRPVRAPDPAKDLTNEELDYGAMKPRE